jgi:hypothetical protein
MDSQPLFLFYSGTSLIGKIIRRTTNSKFSHVALLLDDFHCLELDYKSPTSIKHFRYPKGSYHLYKLNIHLTEQEIKRLNVFIRNNISTKYDWKFIFSRALNIFFGTLIINSKDRYNCDELIVEAYRFIGINLIEEDVKLSPETLSKSDKLVKIY